MADDKGTGYLQKKPQTNNTLEKQIRFIVQRMMSKQATNLPVKVVAVYDADGNKVGADGTGIVGKAGFVDVQPMVNQYDGVGNARPHGIIQRIPFSRRQGGKSAIINDPVEGDIGVMSVAMRDISAVKESGDIANAGSFRSFDFADGMYQDALLADEPDQYLRYRHDGLELIDKNGNKYLATPDGITLIDTNGNTVELTKNGMKLTDRFSNIIDMKSGKIEMTTPLFKLNGSFEFSGTGNITGDITQDGSFTATKEVKAFNTHTVSQHTHTQGNDSHGDTEVPTNTPTG